MTKITERQLRAYLNSYMSYAPLEIAINELLQLINEEESVVNSRVSIHEWCKRNRGFDE